MILGTFVLIILTRAQCYKIAEDNNILDYGEPDINLRYSVDYEEPFLSPNNYVRLELIRPTLNDITAILQETTNGRNLQNNDGGQMHATGMDDNDVHENKRYILFGMANPLIENIYPTANDMNSPNKIPSAESTSKLLGMLQSINKLKIAQYLKLSDLESERKMSAYDILTLKQSKFNYKLPAFTENTDKSFSSLTNKQKRFVIGFNIPGLHYDQRRRRKIKGTKIRHTEPFTRKRFRIDPTYFLFGIGKR